MYTGYFKCYVRSIITEYCVQIGWRLQENLLHIHYMPLVVFKNPMNIFKVTQSVNLEDTCFIAPSPNQPVLPSLFFLLSCNNNRFLIVIEINTFLVWSTLLAAISYLMLLIRWYNGPILLLQLQHLPSFCTIYL